MEPKKLGKMLKEWRAQANLGPVKDACKVLGVSHGALGMYEREESLPDVDFLAVFAEKTGANFFSLLEARLRSGKTEQARDLADLMASKGLDVVRAQLPRGTMDPGRFIAESAGIDGLTFTREWLERKGVQPKDLVFTRVPDDTMSPTVREGNLVVIDGTRDSFATDGIYAMMIDGEIAVRRVQRHFTGGIIFRCDNQAYADQHLSSKEIEDLFIMGKVIWAGGEM
ncbi:helix-turn-helix transcriptional regulator [Marinobacter sp. EN3]|uniref:LexA family transcriptional regulator n=1 Tax=Marinobacter sp. EN3 TaxID=1397533 RepID=UPI001267EB54|nr:LexA family transcriptional regulator [Marinobacter sp. EN3]